MTDLVQSTTEGMEGRGGHFGADIGRMTKGLRDNAKDIFDIWMFQPARHEEFGRREIEDIEETIIGLSAVIRQHNRKKLRVISNG